MYLLQFSILTPTGEGLEERKKAFATHLSPGDALQILADERDAFFKKRGWAPIYSLIGIQEIPGISEELLEQFNVIEVKKPDGKEQTTDLAAVAKKLASGERVAYTPGHEKELQEEVERQGGRGVVKTWYSVGVGRGTQSVYMLEGRNDQT